MRLIDADKLQAEYKERHDGKRLLLLDVQPTVLVPQWIPCSERLPKKPCECLATIEVQIWENTHRTVRRTKFANGRFRGAGKVLAWMPWPDPYGGRQRTSFDRALTYKDYGYAEIDFMHRQCGKDYEIVPVVITEVRGE